MGSPVAALVSHLETVDAVTVYTPIFGLNAMIAQHLGRWGPSVRGVSDVLRSATVARLASPVDLLAVEPSPPPQRRLIAARTGQDLEEPAGHLVSRRVHATSERFLAGLSAEGGRRLFG